MDSADIAPREPSPEERAVCARVMAQLAARGNLVFHRRPNFVTATVVLALAIGAGVGAFRSIQSGSVGAFLVAAGVALLMLSYVGRELARLRQGNELVVTRDAFVERRTRLFGRVIATEVLWRNAVARESSSSEPGLISSVIAFLFAPGAGLEITDRATGRASAYRSITIRQYEELRAALIALAGLIEEYAVSRYE